MIGEGIFRFASLQSEFAKCVLAKNGADASCLDTIYVVLNYSADQRDATLSGQESLLSRSDAVLFVLNEL